MDKLFATSIDEVSRLCSSGHYNFIVVGSGMGGGNVARSLIGDKDGKDDKNKVLMIEQGGLLFTTHCVNTPCPRWNRTGMEGPSMDTDIVYRTVKSDFSVATSESVEYKGGPVHCLGGRSNVWGLYTPRIHEDQLEKYFPAEICNYLNEGGYDEAYQNLCNDKSACLSNPYPKSGPISLQCRNDIQDILVALNDLSISEEATGKSNDIPGKITDKDLYTCDSFGCCPMGVQFVPQDADKQLYNLTMGAYSAVNWELEHAYNKSENLTILLETQVITVNTKLPHDKPPNIKSITVRDKRGCEKTINIGGATVILCAGTVETAAIALRSNIKQPIHGSLVGKGLTDHDIWGTRYKFLKPASTKATIADQSLKVQSWVELKVPPSQKSASNTSKTGSSEAPEKSLSDCLLNITINAPSFLGQVQGDIKKNPWNYFDYKGEPISKDAFHRHLQGPKLGNELEKGPKEEYDAVTVQVVFEFCSELKEKNRVLSLPESVPTIKIPCVDDNYRFEPSMRILSWNIKGKLEGLAKAKSNQGKNPTEPQILIPGINNLKDLHLLNKGISLKTIEDMNGLPHMSKSTFGAVAHEVGTMRMGKDRNKSVVDENLRVHGYHNLYVCDLSVFPVSPSANPSLTLVALAQRLGKHLRN